MTTIAVKGTVLSSFIDFLLFISIGRTSLKLCKLTPVPLESQLKFLKRNFSMCSPLWYM